MKNQFVYPVPYETGLLEVEFLNVFVGLLFAAEGEYI